MTTKKASCCSICLAIAVAMFAAVYAIGITVLQAEPAVRRFPAVAKRLQESDLPIAIVTGANAGIGFETALELLARGYRVVVASRSAARGEEAVKSIRREATKHKLSLPKGTEATFLPLDLANFTSVVDFVHQYRQSFGDSVDALVLNAGMNVKIGETKEERTTVDGFEVAMQANYLGHFLLAKLMLPFLEKAGTGKPKDVPTRIVWLSSVVHRFVSLKDLGALPDVNAAADVDNIKALWHRAFKAAGTYNYDLSKAAMTMASEKLKRRMTQGSAVTTIAVNPGAVLTEIWRHWPEIARLAVQPLMALLFLTPPQGAAPSIAATADWTLPVASDELKALGMAVPPTSSAGAAATTISLPLTSGLYLVPYRHYLPYSLVQKEPFATIRELVGPFGGVHVASPNPAVKDSAMIDSLWEASEEAVKPFVELYHSRA